MKVFNIFLEEFYDNKVALGTYTTKNENDENIIVEVTEENLKISTCQSNGWIKVKCYCKDHIIEEYYEQ